MSKTDKEFALLAISMKYVTQEQAEECLRLLAKASEMGLNETLPEVLIKKGYLNRAQEAAITQALNQPRISHIGKYSLIARIGQGGMGTVYKARQESLDKVVAVKVMAPRLARQRDFVERFIREAQASGRLNHPNIVQAIDAGEADGYYYFAMEYVDGENLRSILERDGKLSERRSLEICAAIATALEHAHKHNIVHRDIKPDNIFIAKDGTPKLGDLGLAKEIRTDKAITQAGIPVGTPYYISPEQVRGQEDIDGRADIYALGATLYRMVAGDVPYDGPTGAVVMTKHLNDPIPDPRRNSPQLTEAVVSIIHHCMQKKRDDRYRNARQLLDDLEAALAGKPLRHAAKPQLRAAALADRLAQRQAADAATRRKLLIGGGVAAALVLLLVLFALLGRRGDRPAPQAVAPTPKPTAPPPEPKETKKGLPPRTTTPAKGAAKPDAKVVLQELTALARDSDERGDIERRLTDFIVVQYPGTPEAGQAKALLADLKARWKAEDDFKAAILDHIAQRRFTEARAALSDPPLKEKTGKAKAMLDDLAAQLARAEASYVAAEASKGEDLIRQGDLAAARELFERLEKLGLPEAVQASKAALPKIAELAAAREQRAAQREFAAAVVRAAPLVAAGKFQEARALFDPARAAGKKPLAALLAAGQGDIDRVAAFFEDVTRELAARAANKGRALVRGIGRPIAKVEDGILHSTLGGSFPIAQLRTVDLDRDDYACLKGKKVLLGLVELYRGDCEAARSLFSEHASRPPDADTARWLQQLEWVEAIAKEGQAAEVLAEAGRLADQGKWKEASEALAKLGDQFGNTAFVETNRAAIGDLNKRVAEAIAATVRKDEAIRPFIDATDKSGDLAKAVKTFKPVGGWVVDIDNDGMLDIAFDIRRKAGDSPLVPVFRNETKPGSSEVVFRDITEQAGIDTGDEPICWADLDGDGDLDIVCRGLWSGTGAARQRDPRKLALYENVGKGTPMFRLDPARCLVPEIAKTGPYANYGFANIGVMDANGDGRPDVFGEYVGPFRTLILFGSVRGKPFAFDDVTEQVGFLVKKGGAFEAPGFLTGKAWPQYVVFDCDGDDLQDILYNSDGPILLRNGARRGFSAVPAAALSYETYPSPATGNSPLIIPAVADYNNDGKIDVFVPQAQAKNLLMQGQGDGTFKDALSTTGPMATDKNDSLWATWGDVNNDGLPDLFVCNASERNRLYIQKGNHAFADKADEYGTTGERGEKTNFALFADFDRDGDLDMIVLRDNGRSQLLLNPFVTGANRYYVSVLVRAPLGTLGAKVTLYRLPDQVVGFQQVCRVEGYNRQTPREAFFGVATAGEYGIKVVLSNGTVIRQRLTVKPDSRNEAAIGKEAR